MTAKARLVLEDCRLALTLLEEETDLPRWRLHWVAAIALVRAVGHVLEKVDGKSQAVRAASQSAFSKWKSDAPEHKIFREFIERERNTILKTYEFNLDPSEEVELVLVSNLKRVSDGAIVQSAQVYPIGENIYRPLLDGFREGDDARDVLSEAIEWWDEQLSFIEGTTRD
jgi:hypothetical protein